MNFYRILSNLLLLHYLPSHIDGTSTLNIFSMIEKIKANHHLGNLLTSLNAYRLLVMKIILIHTLFSVDKNFLTIKFLLNLLGEVLLYLYIQTLYLRFLIKDSESKSRVIFLVFQSNINPKVHQKDITAL